MTLYLKLGGRPAIERAVDELMKKLMADSLFMTRSQVKLRICPRAQLVEFLTYITAGSPTYEGQPLGFAHDGLFISENQADRFTSYLIDALGGHDTEFGIASEISYLLQRVRPHLLPQKDAGGCVAAPFARGESPTP